MSPSPLERRKFRMKETIEKIGRDWVHPYFHHDNPKKVFYRPNEWSGWRFWLKAVRNKDWKSIKRRYF